MGVPPRTLNSTPHALGLGELNSRATRVFMHSAARIQELMFKISRLKDFHDAGRSELRHTSRVRHSATIGVCSKHAVGAQARVCMSKKWTQFKDDPCQGAGARSSLISKRWGITSSAKLNKWLGNLPVNASMHNTVSRLLTSIKSHKATGKSLASYLRWT